MTLVALKKKLLQKDSHRKTRGFVVKLSTLDKNIEREETVSKTPLLGLFGCSRYDTCSAPICPLSNNKTAVWYPDEEICKNREMAKRFRFIRVQRKIQKRAVNRDTYYTLELLERIKIVRSGIRGYTPERSYAK